MRQPIETGSWTVYSVMEGESLGSPRVCSESEWREIAMTHPGSNWLIASGIASEAEAERLARQIAPPIELRKRHERPVAYSPWLGAARC